MSRDKNPQIFIAKLSTDVRESILEHEFKRFGSIRNIELKRGYAFIEYNDYRDAEDAIKDMDGRKLEGNRIVVQHSRGKRRDNDRGDRDRGDRDRGDRGERGDRGDRDDRRFPRKNGPQAEDVCFNCSKLGHWSNECRDPPKPRGKYISKDGRNNSVSRSRSRSRSRSVSNSRRRHRSRSVSQSKDKRRSRKRSESSRYGRSRSKSFSNRKEKSENGNK